MRDLADGGAAADAAGGDRPGAGRHRGGDRAGGELPRVGGFIAALIGSVFIQIGTNLANDYSDAKRGADTADRLGPVRVTSSGLVAPRRVLVATWIAFAVAVVCGIYLAVLAGPVILLVGVLSIAAGVLYTGGPRPYGYAGPRRALRLPLLRPRRGQRLLLRPAREAGLPAVRPLGRGRLPLDRDPRRQQRPRPRDRPPRRQEHARGAARPRAHPAALPGPGGRGIRWSLVATIAANSGPWWGALALLSAPLAAKPARAVLERTDGPALNAALAGTGALLGDLQPAALGRPADSRLSRCGSPSTEVIPFALPFREPYVTAARHASSGGRWSCCGSRDADGIEGLGEAVPLSLRGGAGRSRRSSPSCATGMAVRIRPASPLPRAARSRRRCSTCAPGRRACRPGGSSAPESAEPVRCNATLTAGEPAAVAAQAQRWAAEGFATFKLKVGVPGDVGQVRAVREAVGDEARIRVDANGAWTRG